MSVERSAISYQQSAISYQQSAKVGKDTVIAVGDPWLYDEYTDGRKLPKDFDNYKAAEDLAEWIFSL